MPTLAKQPQHMLWLGGFDLDQWQTGRSQAASPLVRMQDHIYFWSMCLRLTNDHTAVQPGAEVCLGADHVVVCGGAQVEEVRCPWELERHTLIFHWLVLLRHFLLRAQNVRSALCVQQLSGVGLGNMQELRLGVKPYVIWLHDDCHHMYAFSSNARRPCWICSTARA